MRPPDQTSARESVGTLTHREASYATRHTRIERVVRPLLLPEAPSALPQGGSWPPPPNLLRLPETLPMTEPAGCTYRPLCHLKRRFCCRGAHRGILPQDLEVVERLHGRLHYCGENRVTVLFFAHQKASQAPAPSPTLARTTIIPTLSHRGRAGHHIHCNMLGELDLVRLRRLLLAEHLHHPRLLLHHLLHLPVHLRLTALRRGELLL